MWSADQYLEDLYTETIKKHPYKLSDSLKITLKNKFQALLGDFKDHNDALDPVLLEKVDMGHYQRLRVEITTISPMRMPVYVLIPKEKSKEKRSAVLAIHGHGYGSKEVVGLNPDGSNKLDEGYHKNFAVRLVEMGNVVVAPELMGFGDRKLQADQGIGSPEDNSCYMIASQLLLVGKTLAGLRVQECRRVIDYIQSLSEVDDNNIGCMGISGGGLVAAFTSVLDERIRATVISGYTNTFKGSIMDRRHCLDNYIPGILGYAEMPEIIGLIAPRPLFIEAGRDDHLFPLDKVRFGIKKLTGFYEDFEAGEMLDYHIFAGGHEINGDKSFDWLNNMIN